MRLDAGLHIDVRCVACGSDRRLPERAERVLETDDAVFADVVEACECGAQRVVIRVEVTHGEEAVPESGSNEDRRR